MMIRRRAAVALAVLALVAASCGDDADESTEATTTTSAPADDVAATTSTTVSPTTEPPAELPASAWIAHETGPECMCADGSDYWIHSRTADLDKVVLYFQGGGACFTEEMCDFEDGTYKVTTGEEDRPGDDSGGIFDFDNPANPLAEWSFVYVPYCSGDVFLGDATTTYGDLVIEHNGFANAQHGLDFVADNFGDASEILVTGSSAGGVPTPLIGALIGDALPEASIAVLADASGGYASNPLQNDFIGTLWGVTNNVPDWPELEGLAASEFGIPDLFPIAGTHNPDLRMARFDNAFDSVQRTFAAFAGLEGGLLEVLEVNEALAEDAGVDLATYIAPGEGHTILGLAEMYDLEVEGVMFVDWLTDFVAGTHPGDVRCVDCGDPDAAAGADDT